MYVYIKSEPKVWTVGFYHPSGEWNSESDHSSPDAAASRVAFLNGLLMNPKPVPKDHVYVNGEKCQLNFSQTEVYYKDEWHEIKKDQEGKPYIQYNIKVWKDHVVYIDKVEPGKLHLNFPNGFDTWKKTFFEVSSIINVRMLNNLGDNTVISKVMHTSGNKGLSTLASQWTSIFEERTKGVDWNDELEYTIAIEKFCSDQNNNI